MNPDLIRGARGMLNWSVSDLAQHTRVSMSTIKRVEDGEFSNSPRRSNILRAIFDVFIREGIVFDTVNGVDMVGLKRSQR